MTKYTEQPSVDEPSEEDFQLAERLVNHQWGVSVRRLAEAFRDVRAVAAPQPERSPVETPEESK